MWNFEFLAEIASYSKETVELNIFKKLLGMFVKEIEKPDPEVGVQLSTFQK